MVPWGTGGGNGRACLPVTVFGKPASVRRSRHRGVCRVDRVTLNGSRDNCLLLRRDHGLPALFPGNVVTLFFEGGDFIISFGYLFLAFEELGFFQELRLNIQSGLFRVSRRKWCVAPVHDHVPDKEQRDEQTDSATPDNQAALACHSGCSRRTAAYFSSSSSWRCSSRSVMPDVLWLPSVCCFIVLWRDPFTTGNSPASLRVPGFSARCSTTKTREVSP